MRFEGRLKSWNDDRGFGFIEPIRGGARVWAFQREADNGTVHRYLMHLHPKALSLGKEEGSAAAGFQFRNKYEFGRGEA